MKKTLVILLMSCFLLVIYGCDSNKGNVFDSKNTMTCVKESVDDEGYKTTDTMEIIYNSNKVLKVTDTNISETDTEYIDLQLGFGQLFVETFNSIDGMEASYSKVDNNKIKLVMSVDFEKLDPEKVKNSLGDSYNEDDSFYSKNNYTIDDFKKENLDGYTCK